MPRILALSLTALVVAALAATASPAKNRSHGHDRAPVPDRIDLPDGWQPEGIAAKGKKLYVGSIPTGAVWLADARTGAGHVLVPARSGRAAIGLKVQRGTLFVAGGPTGKAFLYDAKTGADIAQLQLAPDANTFVNDVAVTKRAAYFTDSRRAALYVVATDGSAAHELALPDIPLATGNNLNGIVAAGKGRLLAVQGNTGRLWRIDAASGAAAPVDLGDFSATNGDGLLFAGRMLLIVQNRLNRIAIVRLNRSMTAGRLTGTVSNPAFDVPTTLAVGRNGLYAVNARFGTTDPQPAKYWVTRVGRLGR